MAYSGYLFAVNKCIYMYVVLYVYTRVCITNVVMRVCQIFGLVVSFVSYPSTPSPISN